MGKAANIGCLLAIVVIFIIAASFIGEVMSQSDPAWLRALEVFGQ